MTTKLDLLLAAQKSAAASLDVPATHLKPFDAEAHAKSEFAALSLPNEHWPFFRDHYNGARQHYIHAAGQSLEPVTQ